MSMLDRLMIRGIRNFGIDAEDEQKITFSTPLTLILGANGCGKTTIIECIKYALTGKMPPNCKDGFIHDPCVANVMECLGQVKLKIQTINGKKQTVTRSAKVTRKVKGRGAHAANDREQLQFKTLDATGCVEDENGREHMISKRCVDMDAEMCNAMGVSETIINNVLFCHQEESNWPLGTDQELKKKFDDIFGTTSYNTAIEKIRKSRKEYEAKAKDKEVTLKELEMQKRNAETRQLELQTNETKIADLKLAYDKCDTDIKPVTTRINEIINIERHIGQLISQKTEVETRCKSKQDNEKQLIEKIKKLFEGSETELDVEIQSFKESMVKKDMELNEAKKEMAAARQQEQRLLSQIQENERKCIGYVHQREQEQDFYAKRAENLKELCKRLKINVTFDLENANERCNELLPQINAGISKEDENVSEMTAANEQIDFEQQTEIDRLRENRTQTESDISSKRNQITQLKGERAKQQADIAKIERNAQTLKSVTEKVGKLKAALDNLSQSNSLENVRKELAARKVEASKLNDELETLDEQIAVSVTLSSISSEISSKEKQLEKRDSEIRRIKNKHSDDLRRLFNNESIQSNYKQRLESVNQKLRMETNKMQNDVKVKEREVSELTFNQRNKKQELKRWEDEVRDLENKIDECCDSSPFIEVLETVKENVAKYQMEHGTLKSSELFYKKYIKKMEEKPCCPLCHKDLNNNEVGDLTGELNGHIDLLPLNIESAEQNLKEENRRLEALLALQPSVERLEKLKSQDIPNLRNLLNDIDKKLSKARTEKSNLEKLLNESTTKLELGNSMSGDMSLLDEATKDADRIRSELEELRKNIPGAQNELSMDELQKNRKIVADKLKKLREKMDELDQTEKNDTKVFNNLRDEHMKYKSEEVKLKEELQGLSQMKARQEQITTQINDLDTKIQELNNALNPLKKKLDEAIENKQKTKAANVAKLKSAQALLHELKQYNATVKQINQEIRKLVSLNLEEEIAKCGRLADKINNDKKLKEKEIEALNKKIEKLNMEIAGQVSLERDLLDNKELKVLQVEIKKLKITLDGLKKNFDDLDIDRLSNEKNNLIKQRDKLEAERGQINGKMYAINEECQRLKVLLNDPKLKNAIKNYRQVYYEHIVLRKIAKDLEYYASTLDQVLVKYHTEKMIKINRLIRELWRSIYRGNDIDFIEITTEEPKATNKRRNYTYRVVQSKNDVKIDMRGRCSAGQRVLACLIIRIALAETFSSSCGVLALDEPTTNLDRVNIVSLCEALNRIVEERASQSNFMLIVITHDEDFIKELGRVTSFYQVERSAQGKSIINKLRVN